MIVPPPQIMLITTFLGRTIKIKYEENLQSQVVRNDEEPIDQSINSLTKVRLEDLKERKSLYLFFN